MACDLYGIKQDNKMCQYHKKPVTASPSCFIEYLNDDEQKLYRRLSQLLGEDDASTIIDLPGNKVPIFSSSLVSLTNPMPVTNPVSKMSSDTSLAV